MVIIIKVVLIFPTNSKSSIFERERIFPPMGLAYIAAVLERNGIDVRIIDGPASNLRHEDIVNEVKKINPDVVGLSAYTPNAQYSIKLAELIRKETDPHILLGGPHATLFPREILKNKFIDAIIMGEGEYTTLEFVKAIDNGVNFKSIKGLAYKKDKTIINRPIKFIKNLDKLPFPARHLLPIYKYRLLPHEYMHNPVIHILASRGCPYRCIYCSKIIFGHVRRERSVNNVIKEIIHVIKEYNAKEIFFLDDVFTFNRQWIMNFCNDLKENNIDISWSCETRIDRVDKELLITMSKAGCWSILYGMESGNQELLNILKKDITLKQIRNAVRWTKEANIQVRGSFMLALPNETPKLAMNTIKFARELNIDYVQFHQTIPFPGTELHKIAKNYGKVEKNFEKYNCDSIGNFPFIPNGYKKIEELINMQKLAYKKAYFTPKNMTKKLLNIKSIKDICKNVKGIKIFVEIVKKSD